jgi:hypothetical protein
MLRGYTLRQLGVQNRPRDIPRFSRDIPAEGRDLEPRYPLASGISRRRYPPVFPTYRQQQKTSNFSRYLLTNNTLLAA